MHFSILQNERPCFATNLTLHFNILQATPRPSAATESAAPGRGALQLASSPAALMLLAAELAEGTGPSYYATLGLFLLSFPGLYSLVKRSPDPKARARRPRSGRSAGRLRPASPTHPTSLPPPTRQIKRKTFEVPGPGVPGAVPLDDRARSMFAYFKRNNYDVTSTGEVISFEGAVRPDRGTASYIVFCAAIGLASGGLVLSIAAPAIGDSAYWITALAPFACAPGGFAGGGFAVCTAVGGISPRGVPPSPDTAAAFPPSQRGVLLEERGAQAGVQAEDDDGGRRADDGHRAGGGRVGARPAAAARLLLRRCCAEGSSAPVCRRWSASRGSCRWWRRGRCM